MKGSPPVLEKKSALVAFASCQDCDGQAAAATAFCERHLRGRALAFLDRRRGPRVKLGTKTIVGDEQWRPWLRGADASELAEVLRRLDVYVEHYDN